MPAEELILATTRDPQSGVEILNVTGPTTLATIFEFQTALRSSIGPKTIIDLSGVPYMDSAGLGAILSFHVSCSGKNRKYAIVGASSRLLTMIKVSKVDSILSLYNTTTEAESYLAG